MLIVPHFDERECGGEALREVCDVHESSYGIIGGDLGGEKQRATCWHVEVLKRAKQ